MLRAMRESDSNYSISAASDFAHFIQERDEWPLKKPKLQFFMSWDEEIQP